MIIYKDFSCRCSIKKKCWVGQHVLAPWCQIELKIKFIHQNTEQMGRWNEKVPPFCVSRNTYSVCLTLSSYRNTPSRSNFKHSCKHRLVSHLWICVGKCHPFLFRLGVDQLPPDGCFFRGHASQLLSRWSAWGDEKQTRWLSEGETHCKDQTFRWAMCSYDSTRWSRASYQNRHLVLSDIKITLMTNLITPTFHLSTPTSVEFFRVVI